MPSRAAAALAIALVVSSALAADPRAGAAPQATQHRVLATVIDNKDKPIQGLGAADFRILIDDVPQEIISVAPATDPVSVIILTDRLGLDVTYPPAVIGNALKSFVKTLNTAVPGSQVALTTFDGPVVRVANFSLPLTDLEKLLGRLATVAQDAAIRDAMMDVCAHAQKAPTPRRAIFTVFAGYRPDTSTTRTEQVGQALESCGASWWAIEARTTGENSFGNKDRELVVDRGTALSGGMRDIVASAVGVETMSKRMAQYIAAQYEIVYAATGNRRNSTMRKVIVNRPNVKVYAPAWVPR